MAHAMDEGSAVVKAEEAPPRPLPSEGVPVEWVRRGARDCDAARGAGAVLWTRATQCRHPPNAPHLAPAKRQPSQCLHGRACPTRRRR